jgi:hypothetical protein
MCNDIKNIFSVVGQVKSELLQNPYYQEDDNADYSGEWRQLNIALNANPYCMRISFNTYDPPDMLLGIIYDIKGVRFEIVCIEPTALNDNDGGLMKVTLESIH